MHPCLYSPDQGGGIIYFGESFSVSMDMVNAFWKIIFIFMVWKISVNGYNLVSILHYFMENISVLTKCNVLFNNGHLILIWFFLLIDNEFDLKITLKILYPKNHQVYWCKSTKCCYFQNRFQYKLKIICVIKIKTKRIYISRSRSNWTFWHYIIIIT